MDATVPALAGGVVVTGAGSGIGRAAALAAARHGASIAALGRRRSTLDQVAAEAMALGAPDAVAIDCDVRDEAAVEAAIAAAADRIGPLRGLVTCAGVDLGGYVHELELSRWRDVLDTNLTGTYLACKYVLRKMLDHGLGGSIVTITSAVAELSIPGGLSAYTASKGGISALTRSLALDYAAHGIRVNAVLPGTTETALMWANTPPDELAAARAAVAAKVPLGRLAEPDEIAPGIVWLLGPQAAYVTGSHLVIDGGLMARAAVDS